MKIKTIVTPDPDEFDTSVNEYLTDDWELVRRILVQTPAGTKDYHYAQLVKQEQETEFDPLAALDGIRKFCDSVTDGDCGADKCPIHEWCESSLKNAVFSPNEWIIPELGE